MDTKIRILTFDLEDWFHLLEAPGQTSLPGWEEYESRAESVTDILLDLLKDSRQRATFFVLGWLAERNPRLIRKIADAGHSIGSHSYGHQLIRNQGREEFERDFDRSIKVIERAATQKVIAYRAPGFSLTPGHEWVFDVLISRNVRIDASLFLSNHAHGGYGGLSLSSPARIQRGDASIEEFPVLPASFCGLRLPYSGGGYFRLLPFGLIKGLASRQRYVMTYFHPRDFDVTQPRLPGLSAGRRFRAYTGLERALPKLKRWLGEESFIDLDEASSQIDWDLLPRIQL